jgi:hypothetical protein
MGVWVINGEVVATNVSEVFLTAILPDNVSIAAIASLSSWAGRGGADAYCHSALDIRSGTVWSFGDQPSAVAQNVDWVTFGLRAVEGGARAALTVLF